MINKRFIIKETHSFFTWCIWIIVDSETGINYIAAGSTNPNSITPLLDHDGKIVIDKVQTYC